MRCFCRRAGAIFDALTHAQQVREWLGHRFGRI
jgi:hypothetical protein